MNAIVMASGMGMRMRPLTESIPKPLIPVNGVPMIKTVLDGLVAADVDDIYLVVGYLGGSFDPFVADYQSTHTGLRIHLINNPYYEKVNNISSIYVARDILLTGDCFVCEADLYVSDTAVFVGHPAYSCYYGVYREGFVDDWGFILDGDELADAYIKRVCKGVTDCYNMTGISYLKSYEAAQVSEAVEKMWGSPGYEGLYWDEVVDRSLDRIKLKVWPVEEGKITELDTPAELDVFERSLST